MAVKVNQDTKKVYSLKRLKKEAKKMSIGTGDGGAFTKKGLDVFKK